MSPVIQLLPHIADAIAETLTFAELVHCVRVNHEWHDAFTKHLYEDVVTFHSKQVRPGGGWDGCYLIEINYILDANATSRGDSTIAHSPCPQAVSIENIAFGG
ncbi:hypothetical protein BG005_005771 [Podila minutissima]|nr:hypothetical protein BG005_005771 [Podila minutissima]